MVQCLGAGGRHKGMAAFAAPDGRVPVATAGYDARLHIYDPIEGTPLLYGLAAATGPIEGTA